MTKISRETLADGKTRRYTARPTINGRRLYIHGPTRDRVAAEVAALKENARRRRLGLPDLERPAPALTFSELVGKVVNAYPHSEQSRKTLAWNLRRAESQLGRSLVREMTAEQIAAWLHRLPLAQTTKRGTLKSLRYALGQAVLWKYLAAKPAAAVQMPSEPEYDAHPFDSWEEVRRVMNVASNERDRALILFACATGVRPQEWLALRWQDIDEAAGTLTIHRTVQGGSVTEGRGKTRGALRTVYLNRYAVEALGLLPTPFRRDQLIFPGARGGLIDLAKWRRGAWRRALQAAGIVYRPPSGMRDTFATLLLADGIRLEWISKQMGHSSTTVTERHYSRWLKRGEEAELARLNERLGSFSTGAATDGEKRVAANPLLLSRGARI